MKKRGRTDSNQTKAEFRKLLKEAAMKYIEENPNDPAVKLVKSLKEKYPTNEKTS